MNEDAKLRSNDYDALVAERQSRLDALGPRPPWYRVLACRKWMQERAVIMAMDVSFFAAMLRSYYNSEFVEEMVQRQSAAWAMLRRR